MGTHYMKDTTVVAKKSEIQKLYGILYNLPVMPIRGISQKHFRAEPNYAERSEDYEDSYFTMDCVYVCETEAFDDDANRLYSLTISIDCYRCVWDAVKFLHCNYIEYEWLVESEWNDAEPYADSIYVENAPAMHIEQICFVGADEDDDLLKKDHRYKNKDSDFTRSGLKYLNRVWKLKERNPELWDKSEMLKRQFEVSQALETLEGGGL